MKRRAAARTAACLLAAMLAVVASPPALALDPPAGSVVLTVSGRLAHPNQGADAAFDMAMLEKLPQHTFRTRTPWYKQPRKFTGPLLRDVLAAAGAAGATLRAIALNDYAVDIPVDDTMNHEVIVARLLDDKPVSVRDKGPLFIMYPFDENPELKNMIHFSRAAWQLKAILLIP
jgi:hypothetical protein